MAARGATIWARQTIESTIFYHKPPEWFKIWFYIVNRVNHTDNRLFKRGENFMTYKEIMDATKCTRSTVKHCIDYLKSDTMIDTRKTTRGMVVFVLNYDKYQDWKTYQKDTQKDTEKTHRRHTITKHDKHVNNKVVELSPAVKYVSETLGIPVTKMVIKIIDEDYKDYKIKYSIDKMAIEYSEVRKTIPNTKGLISWLKRGLEYGEVIRREQE